VRIKIFVILLFATLTAVQAQNGAASGDVRTIKADVMPTQATVTFNAQHIKALANSPVALKQGKPQWDVYANTPLSDEVKSQLYPQLRKYILNYGQQAAVNVLLDWVQTSCKFTSRAKRQTSTAKPIDRPFYPEEMLYYLNGDSEDFAILFSRIVRDLMGLDVALVNYTAKVDGKTFNHMATAVCFTDDVEGDAVTIGEQRYVIADPTYQGAPVGRTHPHCDNSTATIIRLNR
jgi:hypothetical protein